MAEMPPKDNAIPAAAPADKPVSYGSPPQRPRFIGQKIIKARFQFRFAATILVFLAISAAIVWLQGRMAVSNMIASGAVTDPSAIDQLRLLNSIVGRTIVLGLAITFGLALFFSHYIAGPLFRFEKTLEEMRGGNLAVFVKLRKKDELQETADLFNQALAGLRSKVKIEREALAAALLKARGIATDLRQAGRSEEATRLEAALHEIESLPPQLKI
jgi:methyl-accepting chemotaxis protein